VGRRLARTAGPAEIWLTGRRHSLIMGRRGVVGDRQGKAVPGWKSGSPPSPAAPAWSRPPSGAVEERGFESLFYPEHSHIPLASRRGDGGQARDYADTYDPFVALSAVAAVTTTLKLGTGVCLITQRIRLSPQRK
jgi:hypothetical protein